MLVISDDRKIRWDPQGRGSSFMAVKASEPTFVVSSHAVPNDLTQSDGVTTTVNATSRLLGGRKDEHDGQALISSP